MTLSTKAPRSSMQRFDRGRRLSLIAVLAGICAMHFDAGAGLAGAEARPENLQWPWWRGPYSNGTAVPADGPLAAKPRLAWHSTEFTKSTGGTITGNGMTGGWLALCGLFVCRFQPPEHRVVLDTESPEICVFAIGRCGYDGISQANSVRQR